MAALPLITALLLAPGALASQTTERVLNTHFTYKVTIPILPTGTKTLDLWIPVPSDSPFQKVANLRLDGMNNTKTGFDAKYGNRIIYARFDDPKPPIQATVDFDVARTTARSYKDPKLGRPELYLNPDRLVPTTGRTAEIAKAVVGNRKGTLDKMRAIYEHTVANMQYDYKKESPKLGLGDVAFVCDYKKGNCSDLHSYLISLARSQGIPAFLEYGFPLTGIPVAGVVPAKGTIGGYHCWTWFYVPGRGWTPLDASDGRRWLDSGWPGIKDQLFGQLVLERSAVALSRGRDIVLSPPQKHGPLNNFIYPYAEANGESVDAKWELSYSAR